MDFDFSRQNVDCNDGTVRQGTTSPACSSGGRVDSRLPLDNRIVAAQSPLASDLMLHNQTSAGVASFARDSQWVAAAPADNNTTNAVTIDMALAAEGERIAAEMGRQHIEDLIADALYDHELGTTSHRRQAEAVLAALIAHGVMGAL
jgi:hypothetical protein